MRIPCVAIMAIQAAHQAALEKGNKADAWAINSATGFKRVNAANKRIFISGYCNIFFFNTIS
ncbi:hypothetical protein SARI_01992 [Salmonella enterica subsp. arizonae serovar 62:z4,z23:-]|uniref:Uncharacterized protein n=1 Tax=Salmonella arizonae (strain ATCC BAA-731 / CDC346-86 / RSK2980) TaxID=41514 RepID=A9MHY2_SALAR|nr:hypothetical protein SARI_01992 [Salmonella enterica subsp. arizonae serovar 62:z4,z23:-]